MNATLSPHGGQLSSQSNGDQGSQTNTSPGAGRFPAPRPRSSEPTEAIPPVKSGAATQSPPRPKPRPNAPSQQSSPAPSGQQRPQAAPAQRPGGTGRSQPQLVRPTPKAKVRKARLLVSKVDPLVGAEDELSAVGGAGDYDCGLCGDPLVSHGHHRHLRPGE